MTIDYKTVNGTEVAIICDLENAEMTEGEWKSFFKYVSNRFEKMLPTITILGVDYDVIKKVIANRCKDWVLAGAIVGRLWEMGVKKINYLPVSTPKQTEDKPVEKPKPKVDRRTSKVKDYCINGGRTNCKPVYQLDGGGNVIREFPSCKAAADYYGLSKDGLSQCCRGEIKTCGGRLWIYKERYKEA